MSCTMFQLYGVWYSGISMMLSFFQSLFGWVDSLLICPGILLYGSKAFYCDSVFLVALFRFFFCLEPSTLLSIVLCKARRIVQFCMLSQCVGYQY